MPESQLPALWERWPRCKDHEPSGCGPRWGDLQSQGYSLHSSFFLLSVRNYRLDALLAQWLLAKGYRNAQIYLGPAPSPLETLMRENGRGRRGLDFIC